MATIIRAAKPRTFLDIRSFIGFDKSKYPDSGKILINPTYNVLKNDPQITYSEVNKM